MLLNAPANALSSVADDGSVFLRGSKFNWTLANENAVGPNSLPHTISGSSSAEEGAAPKIVIPLDYLRRSRKSWTDFGSNINSRATAPLSNFVWISASNPRTVSEKEWLYNSLFLEKWTNNIWNNRERDENFHRFFVGGVFNFGRLEDIPKEIRKELYQFSIGNEGVKPDESVVQLAERLTRAALRHCDEPEITLDIDGELSFDLRLKDNRLILAELALDGLIDASVYDGGNKLLERMPHTSEVKFLAALKS